MDTLTPPLLQWMTTSTHVPSTVYSGYLIQPEALCAAGDVVHYVIIVHTAADHVDSRQGIR